jgi:hypothetical protein
MKVDAFSFAVTALLLALSSTPASATIPPISSYYVGQPTYWGNLTQDFYNCAGKFKVFLYIKSTRKYPFISNILITTT